MEFRNIFISNPARLYVQRNQLVIEQERKTEVPLEDIASVLIENSQVTVTAYALQKMCELADCPKNKKGMAKFL